MSKLEKLLENNNFRNNQNYILPNKIKKNIIKYAFSWVINNNNIVVYCIKKIYDNKNYIKKMEINQIWYIDRECISNFNLDLLFSFLILVLSIMWLLTSWIPDTSEEWVIIWSSIFFILVILASYFKNRNIKWRYFIFKDLINSNKVFLKRYE